MYILKKSFSVNQIDYLPSSNNKYRSRALKSRSKLKAAIGLRAALQIFYYIKIYVYLLWPLEKKYWL